eukprot:GHVS01014445.1.p1 GENE.GHVS01014445.1~~GHVS01014445.1.p1  ORF type:complete len:346 (+),score=56.62 GHVS01014445.1:373-1410(+)
MFMEESDGIREFLFEGDPGKIVIRSHDSENEEHSSSSDTSSEEEGRRGKKREEQGRTDDNVVEEMLRLFCGQEESKNKNNNKGGSRAQSHRSCYQRPSTGVDLLSLCLVVEMFDHLNDQQRGNGEMGIRETSKSSYVVHFRNFIVRPKEARKLMKLYGCSLWEKRHRDLMAESDNSTTTTIAATTGTSPITDCSVQSGDNKDSRSVSVVGGDRAKLINSGKEERCCCSGVCGSSSFPPLIVPPSVRSLYLEPLRLNLPVVAPSVDSLYVQLARGTGEPQWRLLLSHLHSISFVATWRTVEAGQNVPTNIDEYIQHFVPRQRSDYILERNGLSQNRLQIRPGRVVV